MSHDELLQALMKQYFEAEEQIRKLTQLRQSLRVVIEHNSSPDTLHFIPGTDTIEAESPRDDVFLYGKIPQARGSRKRGVNPVVTHIRGVLEAEGHPLHTRAIYEALQKRGVHVGGVDPVNSVSSFLSRNRELFQNVERGIWGLRAWNTVNDDEEPHQSASKQSDDDGLGPWPPIEIEKVAGDEERTFESEDFNDVPF